MTTNGVSNVDEADITECDGEKVVTMMDVLQEQQEFEEDANAVLGASDDKECTYSKGYIKRQAIYACLTCCSGAKDDPTLRAGVCLACSLNCHENHELIELYTKRNFRCDCGNPKFNSHPCQFTPSKMELNQENHYNQNFSGIYCICHRPYPDPEATVENEMIQCIICEDWLHSNHLDAIVPANDLYAEMICKACMDKNIFLHDYSQLAVNYELDADVTSINGNDNSKIVDAKSINLVNGKLNDSDDLNDLDMVKEGEIELKDSSSITEENGAIHVDDKKTNETKSTMEISSTDLTASSSEKLQEKEESNATIPTDNDNLESTKNSIDLEHYNNPDEPVTKEKKEIDNTESQLELNKSDPSFNDINTLGSEQNENDENKESTKQSLEINTESITEPTEQVLNYDKNCDGKTNVIEDSTTHANNETKEAMEACYNASKDNDINELSTKLSTTEENNKPTEGNSLKFTENISKEVPDNSDAKVCLQQPSDCEIDSLEAATKELSELMDDEAESNQNGNGLEKTKPNEVQNEKTSDTHATVDTNGLRDDDINDDTEKNALENCNKIPNSTEQDHKRKLDDTTDDVSVKKQKIDSAENCLRPRNVKRTIKGASFWPSTFRQKLCTCNNCLTMYKDLSVLFLTDIEDTVTAYETLGKERIDEEPATQYERGLQALSSLDRVQQINALTEYNKMRDKLLDFLKSFKDRKEVVKEEDIRAFFAGMKPRREPDGVYFCR